MDPKTLSDLRRLLGGEAYQALVTYLAKELESLKHIDNVKEYSKAVDQAIELKAQKKAYEKLKAILIQIIEIAESSKPPIKPGKNDYGV